MYKNNLSYSIKGGEPVVGKVACMGAKNFATKAMVASLLSNEQTYLHNIPHIGDVEITKHLLNSAGVLTTWTAANTLALDPSTLCEYKASLPDSRTNRIPILLLSILLHKFHRAVVPFTGGDNIGKRNVDFHITALEEFGATVKEECGSYTAYIRSPCGRMKGCHITLPYPSVGATETCLFLAVLAEGTSVIKNIAVEPEIIELITMLRSMGAIIFLSTYREIVIHGVKNLHGTNISIIGDRIEAASWATLACASNGRLVVSGVRPDLLGNFLSYYSIVGGGYKLLGNDIIEFYREKPLKHVSIETDVFPGFSTDYQQPFGTLLTQAEGISVIHETVHNQRFGYLSVLNKFGAKAQVVKGCLGSLPCRYKGYDCDHSALIQGPTELIAIKEPIMVPDIRAGLAYVIAAVLAKGTTLLQGIEQIERGYGNLVKKLFDTNVKIERLAE